MFKKYLINNIKKRFLQYIAIVLCQLLLVMIALSASGILLDSLAKERDHTVKTFKFTFRKSVYVCDIYDKLTTLFSESPCDIEFADLNVCSDKDSDPKNNFDEDGFYTHPQWIYIFPSYRHLQNFMDNLDTPAEALPTEEQFDRHERVVILGSDDFGITDDGKPVRFKYTDENHIIIEGEEYLITGSHSGYASIILFGPDQKTLMTRGIMFTIIDIPNQKQIDEIENLFRRIFQDDFEFVADEIPEFQTLLDVRLNAANIIITFFTIFLTVFNIILIYNQMILCRKTEIAVYSFCGFKKSLCILYGLTELLIISVFSSVVSCIIFDYAVKPLLNKYYSTFFIMFSPDYYTVFVLGYIIFSVLLFFTFIVPTLKKSVCEQLRSI